MGNECTFTHFNTFKSIWIAEKVLETVKSACPGHSAPFQLGDLGGITVLRLGILPVEKKTLREEERNAQILVLPFVFAASIPLPSVR